jgi:hypothetical protein
MRNSKHENRLWIPSADHGVRKPIDRPFSEPANEQVRQRPDAHE